MSSTSVRPSHAAYIERVIDLMDPEANILLNTTYEQAVAAVRNGNAAGVRAIDGQFAIAAKQGRTVRMARSLGRPMRYFLAKQTDGPLLVIAERMDEIRQCLVQEGCGDQFHPSYTRMAPAHHVLELELIGCPDPSPEYVRYFDPRRDQLPEDLDAIGRRYVSALAEACGRWLDRIPTREPIGVLFSGGIDSGSVFCVLYHLLRSRGESPARLKCFTLDVEGGRDAVQASAFLDALGLQLFLEVFHCGAESVDYREAVAVVEDYKPLDVQAAAMGLALCRKIRAAYSDWTWLVDGDGGDENLKDYPIEDNPELTIRSVLNNQMLYQEGWGVHAIKHSLTYSGGQSRGHVRSYAPAKSLGFRGFSPYALPNVIEVAEGVPFVQLTQWNHERLYALKGEIVRRGVALVTGMEMPIFPKNRFQNGAVGGDLQLFPSDPRAYREAFAEATGAP